MVIVHMQVCIMYNITLCVKHFALFHMIRTLDEDREKIASLKKSQPIRG